MLRTNRCRSNIILVMAIPIIILAFIVAYQANELVHSQSEIELIQNKLDKKSQEYEWLSEITGDLVAGKQFPEVERTAPYTGT